MFGLQCVYYTGSVVTSDWAAGPQDRSPSRAVGAPSWKEKVNSDVSVCEERWSGVKYLSGELESPTPMRMRKLHLMT